MPNLHKHEDTSTYLCSYSEAVGSEAARPHTLARQLMLNHHTEVSARFTIYIVPKPRDLLALGVSMAYLPGHGGQTRAFETPGRDRPSVA